MYTRRIDDRRGSFDPPENYSGNAFVKEKPVIDDQNNTAKESGAPPQNQDEAIPAQVHYRGEQPNEPPRYEQYQDQSPHHEQFREPQQQYESFREPRPHHDQYRECQPDHEHFREPPSAYRSEKRDGLLDGIFSRLKNIELDDLLLIGLIILLSSNRQDSECGDNDDLLLILGLLVVMGL